VTRILLADDHAVVRQGLKQVLTDSIPEAVFGDASNAQEALEKARTGEWDVLVLDVSLPDRSGLEVLKDVRRLQPRLPVLVLSMHPEEQYAVRLLRAGAAGYLTKKAAARDLVTAVRKVLSGGKYVSPALAERLADVVELSADPTRAPHDSLSDREYQVFRLLAMGKTVKDIGEELSVSPQTVSTHRTRIMEKMGLETNADLAEYAKQNRLSE
jgi:two-component system, NarL family, invasion response regulator UvrY